VDQKVIENVDSKLPARGMETMERPLPDIPTSSSEEESSEDSMVDEISDDSAKTDSSKEEPVLPTPVESQVIVNNTDASESTTRVEEPEHAINNTTEIKCVK